MTNEEKIIELRDRLKGDLSGVDALVIIRAKDALKNLLYAEITKTKDKNDIYKCKEMDDLAQEIIELGTKIIGDENLANQQYLYETIKECYQFRGRRYFKDF